MADLGMITQATAQQAMRRGRSGVDTSTATSRSSREGYFFDYVKDELDQGVRRQDRPPRRAEGPHDDRPRRSSRRRARRSPRTSATSDPSSAIVTIDPRNGYILTMASSGDYGKSKFNLAAQGHRQPGSTFKVMALMAALRAGRGPRHARPTRRARRSHFDDPTYGARSTSRPTAAPTPGGINLVPGDAEVRQHGLHPARARPRARQGRADRARPGHHARSSTATRPSRSAA